MDPTMIVTTVLDTGTEIVRSYPGTAGILSVLAIVPYVARIAYQATKRQHSTWFNSFFAALSRWPGPR